MLILDIHEKPLRTIRLLLDVYSGIKIIYIIRHTAYSFRNFINVAILQ